MFPKFKNTRPYMHSRRWFWLLEAVRMQQSRAELGDRGRPSGMRQCRSRTKRADVIAVLANQVDVCNESTLQQWITFLK